MKIKKIKKRDGRITDFDQSKITNAIYKATEAVGRPDFELAKKLSDKTTELLQGKELPTVEEIQDTVEQVLMAEGEARIAKAYILYRQKRAEIRKEKQKILNKTQIDEVDKSFDINALKVLSSRYLKKDNEGRIAETCKELFERVAIHTTIPSIFFDKKIFDKKGTSFQHSQEKFDEKKWLGKLKIGNYSLNQFHLEALKRLYERFNKKRQMKVSWKKILELLKQGEFDNYEKEIQDYYNIMVEKKFMPNTPALANFGNYLGMGSACFHPEQLISTVDGPKKISEIKVGDEVLTHRGRFRRVKEIFVREVNSLLSIDCRKLPKPTLLVTDEHPILVYKNGKIDWQPAFTIKEGEWVALSYPVETKDIKEIKVSDIVKEVNVKNDKCYYEYKGGKFNAFCHTTKPVRDSIEVDYDLMKLFGFYLAEGTVSNSNCVRFTFSIDELEYCNEIVSVIEKKFGVTSKIEVNSDASYKWLSLRFHSVILAKFFEKIFGTGYSNKKIPYWIMLLPSHKQKGLMSGMIRGDGTIFRNWNKINARLVMSNTNLVYGFWQMCMRCGVFSALGKESMPKMGKLQPLRCTLGDARGQLLMNELFNRSIEDTIGKDRTFVKDGIVFTEVENIQRIDYKGIVYNLEVEEDNSYVANMVSVHNCFVLGIEDSIDSIMETLKQASIIFKAGGGAGYNFSKLRPEGDFVKTTGGVASGPISFMTLFDRMTEVIKQGGCVSVDTIVRTDKGIIPIGKLLNSPMLGENITDYFVFDGNDFNHVYLAQNNGFTEVYTIKTELGTELKATFNHLVATINEYGEKQWKRVIDLKRGDWLIIVTGGLVGREIKLPKLEKQHHNSNKLKIPEILTSELAELLGLYFADGCINNGRFLFSINSKDKELYNRIKNLMKNIFGLEIGEVRDRGTYKDIVFFSKDLEKYFERLNWCKEKASDCFVPELILESKEDVVCAFLRGLFEGDGSIHPDGYPILYSSSKILLEQVQQLLLSLGIISRLFYIPKEKLTDHKGKDMYKLFLLTERSIKIFKEKIGFISKEKNEKISSSKSKIREYCDLMPNLRRVFAQYYKRVGRGCGPKRSKRGANIEYYRAVQHYLRRDRNLTRRNLKNLMQRFDFLNKDKLLQELVNDRYFYVRVKDIKNQVSSYTMEIEVPASGCYIANGLLVHNIRRGANIGILNSNHPDIEKFVVAKKENKALNNFNISVFILSDFWDYYKENKPYPLINPRTKEIIKYLDPKNFLDLISYQIWESAEPGVIFDDTVNKYNPFLDTLGKIEATNPCGEVLLYPYESCNLGSINLWAFVKETPTNENKRKVDFDWEEFSQTIHIATKFLDNVVEVNKYPLPEIEEMTLNTRKIGLGIMGLGNLLFDLEIPYNSSEGLKLMEKIMEFLNFHSKLASIKLARERGKFPYYYKSFYPKGRLPFSGSEDRDSWSLDWDEVKKKIKKFGLRNAFTTVIAPTGSISMIAGCSSGIEPVFSLVYEKRVTVGSFYYIDPVFEKIMLREGLFDEDLIRETAERGGSIQELTYIPRHLKKIFVVALDMKASDHIKALASFQKWTDSSISKTINLSFNSTIEEVKEAILLAHQLGCKDLTIYRDKSIRGVLIAGERKKKERKEAKLTSLEDTKAKGPIIYHDEGVVLESELNKTNEFCPVCEGVLVKEESCKKCLNCGWSVCSL